MIASISTHNQINLIHFYDVIMSTMASQITSLTIVYSTVYARCRSKKLQTSASLAFVRGIHRSPVNSPHKRPVTQKKFPFDGTIINFGSATKGALKHYSDQGSILTFGITCPVGQVAMQVHPLPTMPYLSLLVNNAYEYEICTCPIGQFR